MAQSAIRATSRPIPLNSTRGRHENWRPSTDGNFRRLSHTAWALFCLSTIGSFRRHSGLSHVSLQNLPLLSVELS
jgi:hypothetical protein